MHFAILVITEKKPSHANTKPVDSALRKYRHTKWDWYQVGGRWTGLFDGYDAEQDPANIVPCEWCGATGVRTDGVGKVNGFDTQVIDEEGHPRNGQTGWCNGCRGKGSTREMANRLGTPRRRHHSDWKPDPGALRQVLRRGSREAWLARRREVHSLGYNSRS